MEMRHRRIMAHEVGSQEFHELTSAAVARWTASDNQDTDLTSTSEQERVTEINKSMALTAARWEEVREHGGATRTGTDDGVKYDLLEKFHGEFHVGKYVRGRQNSESFVMAFVWHGDGIRHALIRTGLILLGGQKQTGLPWGTGNNGRRGAVLLS